MNKDHLDFVTARSSANADFLPYSTNRTAPYLLWDDAVSHTSSSRTCCSCTCCRALTISFVILLVVSVFAIVGVVIYLGILTNNNKDPPVDEEIFEGKIRVVEGDRYSSALRDKNSPEFSIKAFTYETMISQIYQKSVLSDAFLRAEVTEFQNGSLVVYFRLHLDRRKLPEDPVQIAYQVMHDEVQKERSVAFKTVQVDPDKLNISGITSKINFVDYFNEESEETVSTEHQTPEVAQNVTPMTEKTTINGNFTLFTTLPINHQQKTHPVDYGKWEPFTSARPQSQLKPENSKSSATQGSRGSVSEISFDWEPDEGIAAFFPSSTPATKRVGTGFTMIGDGDNSREFSSRVLPPTSDEMVFRMDSPALVINRPSTNVHTSSGWLPLAPVGVTEPNSRELLASRDDPKLGFGLRLATDSDDPRASSRPTSSSRNLHLGNQSSHAVIVRLPPGSQPRAEGVRRSNILQSRQQDWQRHRQARLKRIRDENTSNSTDVASERETNKTNLETFPSARIVALDRVNVNDFRHPTSKTERRFERDHKEIETVNEPAKSSVDNETSQPTLPNEPVTKTSVVTTITEEFAVTSAPLRPKPFKAEAINEQFFSIFPELLRLSALVTAVPEIEEIESTTPDVEYPEVDDEELRPLNMSENRAVHNITSTFENFQLRNRSAVSNSVLFNSDEFYDHESDEETNKVHSTESLEVLSSAIRNLTSIATSKRCNSAMLFRCQSGECVSIFGRCNRIRDCVDNSDEQDCKCADYIRANVINSTLCDGIVDCWDFSDENQCEWCKPNMYVCPNARMCIEYEQLCDGIADCPRGEDERSCITIAPNITSAEFGSHWRSGLVMIRKEGQWGKLCMQNFDNFVSETQVAIGDLSRVICQTIGYNDFEEGKELQESFREDRMEKTSYFEPQYNNYSSNARSLAIDFFATPCVSREVISVRCKDFACGRRHQSLMARARIVGGDNSTPGSWPWQAAVYKEGNFMCGASLISDQWLLSAAHCFYQAIDNYWTVRLGVLRRGSRSPYERTHRLSHIIIHPNYIANNFINDIVLLRMENPVPFSEYIRPICLPTQEETQNSILKKQTCNVVGWGQVAEEGDYLPDTLQEVKLPLISAINCRTYTTALTSYARVNQNMFCAGMQRGGRDACLGDSGGPLMCQQPDGRWTLMGITSNGFGCARASRPGIYTKVVNYKSWINKIMDGTLSRPIISSCSGHRCPLGKCLVQRQICDGFADCIDGSDELGCVWPRFEDE